MKGARAHEVIVPLVGKEAIVRSFAKIRKEEGGLSKDKGLRSKADVRERGEKHAHQIFTTKNLKSSQQKSSNLHNKIKKNSKMLAYIIYF